MTWRRPPSLHRAHQVLRLSYLIDDSIYLLPTLYHTVKEKTFANGLAVISFLMGLTIDNSTTLVSIGGDTDASKWKRRERQRDSLRVKCHKVDANKSRNRIPTTMAHEFIFSSDRFAYQSSDGKRYKWQLRCFQSFRRNIFFFIQYPVGRKCHAI